MYAHKVSGNQIDQVIWWMVLDNVALENTGFIEKRIKSVHPNDTLLDTLPSIAWKHGVLAKINRINLPKVILFKQYHFFCFSISCIIGIFASDFFSIYNDSKNYEVQNLWNLSTLRKPFQIYYNIRVNLIIRRKRLFF